MVISMVMHGYVSFFCPEGTLRSPSPLKKMVGGRYLPFVFRLIIYQGFFVVSSRECIRLKGCDMCSIWSSQDNRILKAPGW